MNSILDILKSKLDKKVKDIHLHNTKRIYITIDKRDIKDCASIIFKDLDARYIIASGIENFDSFEILYHFGFDSEGTIVSLKVYLDKEKPEIDSLTDIIPGISYIEREMWELLGINFTGHPDMKHFLLGDEWEGKYPLRKEKDGK
ncbi:MAG: NADH-quinone oxidoreductase subunit C [Candidatus Ratteibacteria bacterium]|nr:NADH-quinone oxidoreductase subunit C [Candidatus Ratteibacteria bacterium]